MNKNSLVNHKLQPDRRYKIGTSVAVLAFFFCLVISLTVQAADTNHVSFFHDVYPVFKRSCTGCHHPGKLKGQLDLTTYQTFLKGGKHGAAFTPSDPAKSRIMEEISGAEPNMPKEGDPLSTNEVALIERWIREGAKDDTPADAFSFKLSAPPIYSIAPVVSALAYSPDGKILAVSGYHEVVLHKSDGSGLIGRLVGESPRIESLAFSPDGKMLAVAGSAPARFGEIQIWDVTTNGLVNAFKVSTDSVYGICFSPEADRVAFGCADKTVRIISVKDGKELVKFDNHSDWVFGTTFTVDGKRLLTGSRDRAMKLIDASNGQFIDDINKLLENVLCIARHPKEDQVVYGGEMGTTRLYKIAENQGRTAANNDVNLVKEFERLPGAVHTVDFSPDGNTVAVGGVGDEVRLFNAKDGKRTATLKGHEGATFAVKFHPHTNQVATAGFDGKVRIYDSTSGQLIKSFVPVPLKETEPTQQAAK
ncbi:MAG TPA: c-type cytochrome domain-containing protein [Candidatus Eisenbacteria bacterium]|jgi:dipeptidyl aminopeptidase/acylaminoacyl peptidase|nr:c-type cytochrome domain-containing protein [Candidatus Eisenbacteria bacterium]